jgi:rhamnose utilization protein RhaD (predicted bifunctional aldolase and dehydrogenase)
MQELYGENMLLIEYVMPGFLLAKHIYDVTRNVDWNKLDGIILLNHGVFTFDNDAKKAYEKMITLVSKAEKYLQQNVTLPSAVSTPVPVDERLDTLRNSVAVLRGCEIFPILINSPQALKFSTLPNLSRLIKQGGLTPEHVIRIKPFPAIITDNVTKGLETFTQEYKSYFAKYSNPSHVCLDLAPRYAIIAGVGAVALGKDEKESRIIADIVEHTITAILSGEQLGAWISLSLGEMFEMEYWELEQAKLKK